MTDQCVIFKNNKTGKVEQIGGSDIESVHWQKFVGNCGLRIFLKNGTLHRFGGFKEGVSDQTLLHANNIYFSLYSIMCILQNYLSLMSFFNKYFRSMINLLSFSLQIIKKKCLKRKCL